MATDELRVLTLNVWFDTKLRVPRTQALVALIRSTPLEVCCLQEVVPEVAQRLCQALPEWSSSDPGDGSSVQPYGVMTLVAPGLPAQFAFHDLPTNMCRRLLVCDVVGRLLVGNVHLESLDSQPMRELQLRACSEVLGASPNVVLVGDFNFDSQRNFKAPHVPLDNVALDKCLRGFVDVWPTLRTERGLTFHSAVNPYIGPAEAMRYDRVMAQLSDWRPRAIELVGDEPVDHLVQLAEREQEILRRPPTPPRPLLQSRRVFWEDSSSEGNIESPLVRLTAASPQPAEATQTGAGNTERAPTTPTKDGAAHGSAEAAPQAGAGDSAPAPSTPRMKMSGRLFLSDHFGILMSLRHLGAASDSIDVFTI